nr:hypothetical protein [Tanacetum cinerariifolium]
MVAILEKTEHNTDFHQIVDFLEASHIRVKTTARETKTLAKVNGRRITKGTKRISQSKVPSPGADETAFLTGDIRYMEAFLIDTSLEAGQDRENIAKTSSMPHEALPRVTSLGGGEGGMQQKLQELMDICTSRQRQHSLMEERIQSQDLGMDQGEDLLDRDKSADKGSDSTDEMSHVLSTLGAANILANGGLRLVFTTASLSVATASTEKVLEQLSVQLARDLEAKFAQKDQIIREQAKKDSNIARIHAKKELEMMIVELDRSNEMVAKHLAQIKKYQAQQNKPARKTERRNFYMSILRSNAGWKDKDSKGMTFEQIEEKFIPVWEKMQDFVPMDSKLESKRLKRPGIQLDKERIKKLKTAKASGIKPTQEQQSEEPKELSKEELKKMMELDPDENSSQSPPHINQHYCYGCSDSLDGIFCQQCTCESCGNDAHYGYNCPPKVLIISNLEPYYNQNIPIYYDDDDDEESSTPLRYIIIFELPPCIAFTPVLPTKEPVDSLIIKDEHLDTILATESDEVIKSSVEDFVPIPSESEGISDNMCDVPFRDNSSPLDISNVQFEDFSDSNDDSTSIDDDYFSIEDIDYVEASPPDYELVSLEEVKDFDPEDGEIDTVILLTIKDDILHKNLLKIYLLIAKIEALNDNPTPDCMLKSPSLFPISSLPDYDSFLFEIEPDQGLLTRIVMEDIFGEPHVHVPNALPTHPTLMLDSDFIPSNDSLGSDLEVSFPSGTRNKIFDPVIFFKVQSKRFLSPDTFFISFIHNPLCPLIETLLPFSSENKDQVFNPGILYSNHLSHRGKITFDCFKNPMMISGWDIPFLEVLFYHFYPP